jgi:hypothetical protein
MLVLRTKLKLIAPAVRFAEPLSRAYTIANPVLEDRRGALLATFNRTNNQIMQGICNSTLIYTRFRHELYSGDRAQGFRRRSILRSRLGAEEQP